jgi:signal transduction histidine kinase
LFQNLLANACKFHKPDRPPTVTLTAERLESVPITTDPPAGLPAGWRLVVSDDGIGFEQQYADKIFEVFQRLHGRGTYEGTGIGLAICRKIVERHGGIITARGRPGVGAVFAVDLPDPPPVDSPQ